MSDDAVVLAFLERLVADRNLGRVLPLAAYQELYPGYDSALAEAYAGAAAESTAATLPRERSPFRRDQGDDAIGPYRLVRELGRGGQGVVHLARDVRVDRPVALKVLTGLGLGSHAVRRRFQREAVIASKLNHPNVCTVYEADIKEGVPYIAMEVVAGVSLASLITSAREQRTESGCVRVGPEHNGVVQEPGRRTETSAGSSRRALMAVVALGEKIARALHHAHEAGIVHRDVKPGNIMVTESGEPLLMDFGLAWADSGDEPALTLTGDLVGTPAYMSPEQLAPGGVPVDLRTDVYSLGATLYECLTLTRPLDAPTREGLHRQILAHDPAPARRLNPWIPRELGIVLETALEKDRDRRYQTALDVAEELRRVRMLEPIRAKPAGPWLRLIRWAQREPATAAALVFTILFLAGLAGVYAWKSAEVSHSNVELQGALTRVSEEKERVTRLKDRWMLRLLLERAQELYPPGPDLVEPLATWLADAAELTASLPGHRAARSAIEERAESYTEEQKQRDHPQAWQELTAVEREMADLAAVQARTESPSERSVIARTLQEFDRERQSLEVRVSRRLTRPFGDEKEWIRELLTDLVLQIEALDKPNGIVADVRSRLERARAIGRTLVDHAEAWAAARARIRSNPRYRGLRLEPQLGLIPLGPDPHSGLEEFLHWLTHAPGHPLPQRDGEGRLPPMDGETGIVLVLLPGGVSVMGATRNPQGPNYDPAALSDHSPPREVTLDPFFLGKHELTRGQFVRLSGQPDPSYFTNARSDIKPEDCARHPVEMVSWRVCRQELQRGDLVMPTEARWEYACRAGTETPWSWGTWDRDFPAFANLGDETYGRLFGATKYVLDLDDGHAVTAPVGSYAPNPFGLHDMHGNVHEWCLDLQGPFSGERRAGDGLLLVTSGTDERIVKGGSLDNHPGEARSSDRPAFTHYHGWTVFGVRAARDVASGKVR